MRKPSILIVVDRDSDSRIASLAKLLDDSTIVLVSDEGSRWDRLDATGSKAAELVADERPRTVDAMLVHGSDWASSIDNVRKQLSGAPARTFVFNASGDPPVFRDAIRILRRTNPFELTKRDAEQLVAFAVAQRPALPDCCRQLAKSPIALDILCQGFRAAHGDSSLPGLSGLPPERLELAREHVASTERIGWWLAGLGTDSVNGVSRLLVEESVASDDAVRIGTGLQKVVDALDDVARPHRELGADDIGRALTAVTNLQRLLQPLL